MAIEQQDQHPVNVFQKPMSYNAAVDGQFPTEDGKNNNVKGIQLVPYAFLAKAILDIRKDMVFQQTAVTRSLPKYSGKTMKMYRYMPVIDDRNQNDQGIDANGIKIDGSGNFWGSSRDPGNIIAKMPWGREGGGRINRIGFTRKEIKSDLKKVQFFWEYTEDDMLFDSDKDLYMHISELSIEASNKIIENLIQLDLKANAGNVIFGGDATSVDALDATDNIDYNFFLRMNDLANENDIPMNTSMIKGSTKVDTKVVSEARVLYVPEELYSDLEAVKDSHGKQAFLDAEHYAAAGNLLDGEMGKIGKFRLVGVRRMQLGGVKRKDTGQFEGINNALDVYPLILVGKDSYNAVTLHNGGQGNKFKWRVISKKPGFQTADSHDPYGENGWFSTRCYYGFLPLRPERIVVGYVTKKQA